MNESNQQTNSLIGQLRQLQPAPFEVDVRQAFYQAGYEACRRKPEHETCVILPSASPRRCSP